MDKSRADEAGVVGVGEVGVMAMEKCAGLSLEFGKLWVQSILSTAACCHAALWPHLAIREMTPNKQCKPLWAHLPENMGNKGPICWRWTFWACHMLTIYTADLFWDTLRFWNCTIIGYSKRFWWISNISMLSSFISVVVCSLAKISSGKKGFIWFTVPCCSPSLRVSQDKNSNT